MSESLIERRRFTVTLSIAAVIVVIDAATKELAATYLNPTEPVAVLGGAVHLHLLRNPGAATGIFGNHTLWVSLASIVIVGIVFVYARHATTRLDACAFGFLLGGGAGNLVDRIVRSPGPLRGAVVDWIQPGGGHGVMNLADMALNVGIVLLLIAMIVRAAQPSPSECPEPLCVVGDAAPAGR
jgi:signal peptidase II